MARARIRRDALPAPEQIVRNAVNAYRAALVAHRDTVGVPAPLPAFDIVYDLVRFDDFDVTEPPEREPDGDSRLKQAIDGMIATNNALTAEVTALKSALEQRDGVLNRIEARLQALEAKG